MDVPVAFIVFNRPDLTLRTFAAIRRAQPKKLCIISDGPRAARPGESEQVRQSRAIAENCDWPCEIEKIYSDVNLGCQARVSSGITEVFERHERAIIIEDDCDVSDSFFDYCRELLDRYADDQRVMSISGNNFHEGRNFGPGSYYFSKYPHCWGWASWRRAWQHYATAIDAWPNYRGSQDLRALCHSQLELDYWIRTFDQVHEGRIDTWDYTWLLACWMQNGLTALPNRNLVSNLGFRHDATHTDRTSDLAELAKYELDRLVHPPWVSRSFAADQKTDRLLYSGRKPRMRQLLRAAKRWATLRSQVA